MNTTERQFDYSMPYDIMVGVWTGHSIMYDAKGEYMYTGPSLLSIYWKDKGKLLHYHQKDLGDLDEVLDHPHKASLQDIIVTREFDLVISDKACQSVEAYPAVSGVESRPGTYLFDLSLEGGHYYNNQYFQNPNERHIIGPFVPNGGTGIGAVVAQTFTRISYDVPDRYRAEGAGKRPVKKKSVKKRLSSKSRESEIV